jgi:hypothetical protein
MHPSCHYKTFRYGPLSLLKLDDSSVRHGTSVAYSFLNCRREYSVRFHLTLLIAEGT